MRRGGTAVCISQLNFETSILTLLRKNPFVVYKIFQMDYNRNTGCLTFLISSMLLSFSISDHRIKINEFLDRPTATRTGKVQRRSSSLLAAGTASGLRRVDVLYGRRFKGKSAYGGADDVDSEGVWSLLTFRICFEKTIPDSSKKRINYIALPFLEVFSRSSH